MSKEMVTWVDQALYAYYSEQTKEQLINMVAGNPSLELDAAHKLLNNPKVNSNAKRWLKKNIQLLRVR